MLKKGLGTAISLLILVVFSGVALARSEHSLAIPDRAREVGPGVFSLGEALDVDGRKVSGFMIVKRAQARPGGQTGGGKPNQCYAYLASGAKWKVQEPYLVDPVNTAGLDANTIHSLIAGGISKWETAAIFNISGDETSGTVDGADTTSLDGKNEVMFGTISDPNVIAVTTVWGVFSGPTRNRYLAEWDQVYNQAGFAWSTTGESGKMDFENIAVHEIGHALGMGHPVDTCAEETMYRYASYGETKKRDLNSGDIKGIDSLY